MFTPPDKPAENEEELPVDEEIEVPAIDEAEEIPEADIHTMPDRFLQPSKKTKKRGRLNWIILGVVIFVALGGVIVTVILFLGRGVEPTQPILPAPNVNTNQPAINENLNQNENQNLNQNQNVNQNLDSAAIRDIKRLGDIAGLRTALALYNNTYQVFPASLSSLLTEFLDELPLNPSPGGANYSYTVSADRTSYELTFALEEGGDWGIVKLPEGDYYATPEGVFPKSEELVNINTNTNINTNDNTNGSLPQPPLAPTTPSKGLDSDGDQLTDIEENIYQTNSTLADTDGDGFTDASEILNHYDPLTADGRLINSGLIDIYQNPNYYYSLFYPAAWVARSLTANNSEVIFTATTGEFVEIIVQENILGQSAYNWFISQSPGIDTSTLKILTVAGFPAVQTADGLTTYVAVGSNIYILTYNIGTQQQMNFYTTYQLFLKSFIFIEPEQEPEPEA